VTRRELIALLMSTAAVAWPFGARAQQAERMRKIGVLMPLAENDPEAQRRIAGLMEGLRDMGWTEGQSFKFETRYANGHPERLPTLAAELVHTNVDVIVTNAAQPIEAARNATRTIPIVMATVGDAVGAGYVGSLARPGGNITGLTLVATEQSAKRLSLIKQVSPDLARVAVLWNGGASGHRLQMKEMEIAAPALGIILQSLPVRSANEINAAFEAVKQTNAQALVTMDDPLIQSQRAHIVEFALQNHLPVMGETRPTAAAGGLMSYGPNPLNMWRRAAAYVDKILKGSNPGDLPVEQPTAFELVINIKTANALGLTIPPTLLALADEVIE
jgi:putative tryptophan/tyrosine transport system substrate-binding protein